MSPETKKLLEGARRHEPGPDPSSKDRLRRNVLASIATTAGVAATGSASAAGAGSATSAMVAGSTSFVALKLGAVGLVVVTAGVVAVRSISTTDTADKASMSAAPSVQIASPSDATTSEPEHRRVDAAVPPSTADVVVPPAPSARTTAAPSGAKSAVTSEVAVVTPESLDAERALIGAARSKLASGDNAGALAALGEHAAAHPRGALSSERRALMAIAYCNQGSVAQGLRAFPLPADGSDSPLSARVRAACAK